MGEPVSDDECCPIVCCPKCGKPIPSGKPGWYCEGLACSSLAPPSQRAELLTQEQLRVHKACVEVINHAPFRQDISELINAARALSDAYAALTQREAGLVAALRKYGAHTNPCDVRMGFGRCLIPPQDECTCGLDAILNGAAP